MLLLLLLPNPVSWSVSGPYGQYGVGVVSHNTATMVVVRHDLFLRLLLGDEHDDTTAAAAVVGMIVVAITMTTTTTTTTTMTASPTARQRPPIWPWCLMKHLLISCFSVFGLCQSLSRLQNIFIYINKYICSKTCLCYKYIYAGVWVAVGYCVLSTTVQLYCNNVVLL